MLRDLLSPSTPKTAGVIVLLGLMAGTLLLLTPEGAAATPINKIDTIYFDDASHTVMVGEQTLNCDGSVTGFGGPSSYFERSTCRCPC